MAKLEERSEAYLEAEAERPKDYVFPRTGADDDAEFHADQHWARMEGLTAIPSKETASMIGSVTVTGAELAKPAGSHSKTEA